MSKKIALFAASTAISMMAASGAQAALVANVYNSAVLHGNGASSVANVLVQTLDCYGGNPATKTSGGNTAEPLGFNNNSINYVPAHDYVPASPTAANPVYHCATQSVQPNIDGEYVSTGSGGGRSNWYNFTASAAGGATNNPFVSGAYKSETWNNIHYAFSDAGLASSELSSYTSGAATHGTGAAIQIPAYVLPVAVAYAPVYGKRKTATGVSVLSFNLKFPRADGTGGLRLKTSTFCGIMNGTITNWNDAAIKVDNGGQSLMSLQDDVTRWNSAGVPIKLVGRQESSGTTNIFTRHAAAVCGGDYGTAGTNTLPAARLSTAVYDKVTGALTSGSETAGKFGVANGSDGVAATLDITLADPTTVGTYTFNGRLGYEGADWILPSTISGSGLHSADLQSGTTTKFLAPNATNATLSFKGILPPQSASTGKYLPSAPGDRTNPLSWVQDSNASNSLANPVAGYPIVGTTNMLLYTCYADPNVRTALNGFLALQLGKMPKDSTGANIPVKLVSNTAKAADGLPLGILPRNGIAPLPAAFVTAIYETFMTKTVSGNNPAALNLWIQNKLPAKTADIATLQSNPGCTAGTGA